MFRLTFPLHFLLSFDILARSPKAGRWKSKFLPQLGLSHCARGLSEEQTIVTSIVFFSEDSPAAAHDMSHSIRMSPPSTSDWVPVLPSASRSPFIFRSPPYGTRSTRKAASSGSASGWRRTRWSLASFASASLARRWGHACFFPSFHRRFPPSSYSPCPFSAVSLSKALFSALLP